MNTTHYSIYNAGTAAFPSYFVRRDVWDAEGYDLEHLSETVNQYAFMTIAAAEEFVKQLEQQ